MFCRKVLPPFGSQDSAFHSRAAFTAAFTEIGRPFAGKSVACTDFACKARERAASARGAAPAFHSRTASTEIDLH